MSDKMIETLMTVGTGAVLLILGLIAIKIICVIIGKAMNKTKIDKAIHKFLMSIVKISLCVVLVVVLLAHFKINVAPIITVLGAAGAAVALALKDSLGNVAGGMIILANKLFSQGDTIEIAGFTGEVQMIDLFVTTLKTGDNKVISIPNGLITTSIMTNTVKDGRRRLDCVFGISYDDDIGKAKDILLAVAESDERIYKTPAPVVGVAGHLDSSVAIDLKVWCNTGDYGDVKYFIEENVKLAFDEAGISIPFPQMDVHVKKS